MTAATTGPPTGTQSTPEPVLQISGLSKSYGTVAAVTDLRLAVRRGEVYGLLGRNGAGKTTAMRMLLGLVEPTAGTAAGTTNRMLGHPLGHPAALRRTGSLVELPAFYPHLSGRDNLRLLARYAGIGDDQVERALTTVELGDRATSKFRIYSLGMKQRLGVAAALLGDPELLILDEPTNGLDPAGMAAMRTLVRSLGAAGRTVLLSSHLLGEVEQVCDRVGILHDGHLVAEGTVAEIQAAAGGSGMLRLRAAPTVDALAHLERMAEVTTASRAAGAGDDVIEVGADPAAAAAINRNLVMAGIAVSELRVTKRSLEELFLGLTGDAAHPAPEEDPGENPEERAAAGPPVATGGGVR